MAATKLGSLPFSCSLSLHSVAWFDSLVLLDHCSVSPIVSLSVYDVITHRHEVLPLLHTSIGRYIVLVHDASTQKYKVVMLSFSGEHRYLDGCYTFLLGSEIEESWRQSTPPLSQRVQRNFLPVVVKGMLYWIAERREEGYEVFAQPMNVATEEFMASIPIPYPPQDGYASPGNYRLKLLEMKESLCLAIATSPNELELWVWKGSVESIWVKSIKFVLIP